MIFVAITHLLPSSKSVAVRTEKPQISFVCFPVFKPIVPIAGSLALPEFFGSVNMVNIKNPVIGVPAANTATTKIIHNFDFSRPVPRLLVLLKAVFIPVVFAALVRTKAMLTGFPTPLAIFFPLPSCGKITRSAAIFSSAVFYAILMGFKTAFARKASDCYGCLFHLHNIACKAAQVNFDIAVKRIEHAQRQGNMFITPVKAKPEKPAQLFGDAA